MAGTYRCPNCTSETVIDEGDAPLCVPCQETMVLAGATLPESDSVPSNEGEKQEVPVAPLNTEAYVKGLNEIEEAKRQADQEEREYLRAKDYASKAKKRLEAAESKLRGTVQAVADRLRPRPLFEGADHHTEEELVAMLAAEHVQVTAEAVRGWTEAQRADARAWCLAAHSEQPRLIPPFLWAGDPADDLVDPDEPGDDDAGDGPEILEGESAVDFANQRLADNAPSETEAPPEPPAPEPEHHYTARTRAGRTRTRRQAADAEAPEATE